MVRFIHTSDWQLGMRRRFLSDEAQPRFSADRIAVIPKIAALAAERGCTFVVVAGDVFEDNATDRQTVARALDAMAAARIPFYLLPGNHDPLNEASIYRSAAFTDRRPPNVTVLDGHDPLSVAPGVELVAAPWRSKHPTTDLVAEALSGLDAPGGVRITVGHGTTAGMGADNPAVIDLAAVERALSAGLMQYLALGDRHSLTSVGASGRVWYSGAPEATDYDEVDSGKALVVDLEPGHCTVDPVPIGAWRFIERKVPISGREDVDALGLWLDELPAKTTTILKLSFQGAIHLKDNLELEAVLARARTLFAAVEEWERHMDLAIISDATDFDGLGLSGFAGETVRELQSQAAGAGQDSRVATDALELLFRLAGGVA